FFQAEDGIRDFHVTGVQTCALPISVGIGIAVGSQNVRIAILGTAVLTLLSLYLFWTGFGSRVKHDALLRFYLPNSVPALSLHDEIGRASCRERVEWSGVADSLYGYQ